ncbi:hypothetical protein JXR93_10005 [bacterium]|nr:hypothetical protein [bacterium]
MILYLLLLFNIQLSSDNSFYSNIEYLPISNKKNYLYFYKSEFGLTYKKSENQSIFLSYQYNSINSLLSDKNWNFSCNFNHNKIKFGSVLKKSYYKTPIYFIYSDSGVGFGTGLIVEKINYKLSMFYERFQNAETGEFNYQLDKIPHRLSSLNSVFEISFEFQDVLKLYWKRIELSNKNSEQNSFYYKNSNFFEFGYIKFSNLDLFLKKSDYKSFFSSIYFDFLLGYASTKNRLLSEMDTIPTLLLSQKDSSELFFGYSLLGYNFISVFAGFLNGSDIDFFGYIDSWPFENSIQQFISGKLRFEGVGELNLYLYGLFLSFKNIDITLLKGDININFDYSYFSKGVWGVGEIPITNKFFKKTLSFYLLGINYKNILKFGRYEISFYQLIPSKSTNSTQNISEQDFNNSKSGGYYIKFSYFIDF